MTGHSDADRARVRAQVASAGQVLFQTWPLRTFVAVNPLGGLEHRPFEEAVQLAGALLRTEGHMSLAWFRDQHARGRVTDADLTAALLRRLPRLGELPALVVGDRDVLPIDVLRADLLHGPEPTPAPPVPRGAAEWCDALLGSAVAGVVDEQVAKWCAAFCADDGTRWAMPGRERGFYRAWRDLVGSDPAVTRLGLGVERMRNLPDRAEDAVLDALAALQVPDPERRAEFRAQLTRLPGWTGHLAWRTRHPDQAPHPADLLDLLAVRLTYEAALTEGAVDALQEGMADLRALVERRLERAADPAPAEAATRLRRAHEVVAALAPGAVERCDLDAVAATLDHLPRAHRGWVWLDAYEWHYRDRLLHTLSRPWPAADTRRPAVQAVFCIDARSEGLRRHLEGRRSSYRTYGLPGFFQLAVRYRPLGVAQAARLCPVPLTPARTVDEQVSAGHERSTADAISAHRHAGAAVEAFHAAKDEAVSPFALAEAAGWLAGPLSAARTFAPVRFARVRARLARRMTPGATDLAVGYDLDEQTMWAEFALRSLGLVDGFARVVLFCGHGSRTENNAFEAALDCGACGGQAGGPNARAAAEILNRPAVRARLAHRGIHIPADTVAVAAEHDTASDRVTILDAHRIPDSHRDEVRQLAVDLDAAGTALADERSAHLPGRDHPRRRARDWAQVRPEWGLARHAAFVVGPGETVRGLDLQRRTFLHSYDWQVDEDGRVLETILTAPGLVVQWINAQYYFSCVAPGTLGAGDKTLHNVVSDIGVLQGHAGDLQLGLPWQSVAVGERLYHEPMRALYVIEAPLDRIDTLIARNALLQHYVGGQWVTLVARERPDQPWRTRRPRGGWDRWLPADAAALATPTEMEVRT